MAITTFAAALVLFAPVGVDPDVALQEINIYRTTTITEARANNESIDIAALNAKIKEMALEAIKDVKPSEIDPKKGYSWMQLHAMAEKYDNIEALCKQYMMSQPTKEQMFNAELACLQAFYELKEFNKGVDTIRKTTAPSPTQAMTLVSYGSFYFASAVAEEQGLEAAMDFYDELMGKLPNEVDDNLTARLASSVASIYEAKAEMLFEHGKKDAALKMFEAGLKDSRIPEANARSLNMSKTRLMLVGSAPAGYSLRQQVRRVQLHG